MVTTGYHGYEIGKEAKRTSSGRIADSCLRGARSSTEKEKVMNLYMIRRKKNWTTPQRLEASARLSARVGNVDMPDKVRWIRSYVVEEDDGTLGTLCIYEGIDEAAVREHAERSGMTADEVRPIANTVVVREDPAPASESPASA
jgi:hypothetical protein